MKKILIIEDNVDNMELLKIMLENKYNVVTAYTGQDGLNKAYREIPDVILLDLTLPDISGLDIAKRIRTEDSLSHVLIIALSAHSSDSHNERAIEAGCNEYISKPFESKRLYDLLEKLTR